MSFKEKYTASRNKITSTMDRATGPVRWIWPRFPEALIGMLAIVIVIFCVSTFSTTLARSASQLVTGNKYLALVEGLTNPFRNRQILLNQGYPIYDLKIAPSNLFAIEQNVEKAKKKGWMSDDMKLWVDADFICDGEKHNVKVRVRGDLPNHWETPKKSWAIKFGKQKIAEDGQEHKEQIPFRGKHRINLIIPMDRDYVVAPLVNSLMRDAGLVVPHDQFAVLRINGTLQGLYYEVEDFDKPMLASQRRPETSVLGGNDRTMQFEQYTKDGTPVASDTKYDIGSMRRDVDTETEYGMRAVDVLIKHSLDPTKKNFDHARAVMDWEKFQRFRVITTLFNTNHVRFGSDNLKLFYDPSRGLLEPIPWDVHLVKMPVEPGTIDYFNSKGPDELQRATLMDPELRFRRNKMMWELIGDGGKSLIAKYTAMHDKLRPLAWADVLATPVQGYRMDVLKKEFEHNVRRVYKVLSSSTANVTYRLEANDRAALEIAATNFSGIRLDQIELTNPLFAGQSYRLFEDANHNGQLDESDPLVTETAAQERTIYLPLKRYIFPEVKYGGDTLDGRYWEYFDTLAGRRRFFLVGMLAPAKRHPLEWSAPEVKVSAVNAVSGSPMLSVRLDQAESPPADQIGITVYNASDPFDLDAPQRTLAEFLKAYPQFTASAEHAGAAELHGAVTISDTVYVPHGVPLILLPGADIKMAPQANVLCYGGLKAIGTSDKRISIHGDGSGEPWGSFAVLRPAETVVLRYVDVQDGGQAHVNGILLTGGFAVHNGNLDLEHCRISNMKSEDGFNLKNGHLLMNECLISGNAGDGVDADFTTGEVKNCDFIHMGNDGLDMSGSTLTVTNCRFENNGDKGISVGEDSHPVIVNNLFRGNVKGMAVKDLSHAKVAHGTFVANKLAIEAIRKKPMFGGGSGEFLNCVFSGNNKLLDEDYFSKDRIQLSYSLLDESIDSPSCRVGNIQFVSPETGDYRIAPAVLEGKGFQPATADWLKPEAEREAAPVPGVVTLRPNPISGIQ